MKSESQARSCTFPASFSDSKRLERVSCRTSRCSHFVQLERERVLSGALGAAADAAPLRTLRRFYQQVSITGSVLPRVSGKRGFSLPCRVELFSRRGRGCGVGILCRLYSGRRCRWKRHRHKHQTKPGSGVERHLFDL